MVPPPNNTGDEFPDFDSMTPEEQMAWLESLAKRQGANQEEFTTAADLEIAEVSPDTVIDEPGYVPYSISEKPAEQKKAPPPPPAPEPEPEPVFEVEPDEMPDLLADLDLDLTEEEPVASGSDPMQWLDSLSAQTEAELPEPAAIAEEDTAEMLAGLGEFDELGADIESDLAADLAAAEQAFEFAAESFNEVDEAQADFLSTLDGLDDTLVEPAEAPVAEVAPAGDPDDPLGGMDPMLWLESLAKRQGANTAELTTSADLEVEQLPEDTIIDEPGYVPYDIVSGGAKAKEPAPAPEPEPLESIGPAAEFEWEAVAAEEASAEADELAALMAAAEAAGVLEDDELEAVVAASDELGGADPMEWLESLARRQGAKTEELTTAAGLDIPELPADTVVDEPGYVAFSAFDQPVRDEQVDYEEEAAPEPEWDSIDEELAEEPEAAPEPALDLMAEEPVDESLAWLANLAADPNAEVEDLFGASEEPIVSAAKPEPAPVPSASATDDPLAGMTDEEVAYAQAHNELTPQQELAWLKRKAASLAEVHEAEFEDEIPTGEIAPAEPVAAMPAWLQDMRPDENAEAAILSGAASIFSAEADIEVSEADLGDWLESAVDEVAELSLGSDVDSLWAETEKDEAPAAVPSDSELAELIASDFAPDETDQLAEALDAEYERKIAGDESEPEWYREAVERAQQGPADLPVAEATEAETPPEPIAMTPPDGMATTDLTAAVPVDMPDWLVTSEESAPAAPDPDMPAWLTESVDYPQTDVDDDMPDWLKEVPDVPVGGDMGWLEEEVTAPPVPSTPPAPSPAPAAPVSKLPAPSIPQPEPVPSEVKPEVPAETVRPLPQGELFEQYRRRLEMNPNDHATRLALARALRTSSEFEASLDQYEALIEVSQLLPDIGTDLGELVKEHADEPRIRRLLGDTFMRQGMLQAALEAYRGALDQL